MNPQTLNPYVYCLNNPLKYIDPDGESPWDHELLTDMPQRPTEEERFEWEFEAWWEYKGKKIFEESWKEWEKGLEVPDEFDTGIIINLEFAIPTPIPFVYITGGPGMKFFLSDDATDIYDFWQTPTVEISYIPWADIGIGTVSRNRSGTSIETGPVSVGLSSGSFDVTSEFYLIPSASKSRCIYTSNKNVIEIIWSWINSKI